MTDQGGFSPGKAMFLQAGRRSARDINAVTAGKDALRRRLDVFQTRPHTLTRKKNRESWLPISSTDSRRGAPSISATGFTGFSFAGADGFQASLLRPRKIPDSAGRGRADEPAQSCARELIHRFHKKTVPLYPIFSGRSTVFRPLKSAGSLFMEHGGRHSRVSSILSSFPPSKSDPVF